MKEIISLLHGLPRSTYWVEPSSSVQIQINQLLIFFESFSPLPGFDPGTSLVESRRAYY